MELRKKTYNAVLWSFIDRSGDQLLRFVVGVILARLLLPEHFGIIGMAYIVTEIARIFVQSGFGMALINNSKCNSTDESSVFFFNIIIGALLTLFVFILSPFIAKIYHCQELALVLRYLSFNILIGSFGTIQTVLLTKSINFKQQTKVSVLTTLVSGLFGVILAYLGFGVWSLVGQALLRSISYTTLMWLTYEWRPILKFSISSLSSMFKFGSMILLNSLFKLIFQNIYTILIGIYYSPAMLGIYTRAKQTQQLPVDTIWAILGRVIFPVISKIKNDNERIVSAIKDISNNIAFFVFPFLIIGMMVSDELFIIVFGSAWKPSIIYFKILCIGSIFYPLEYLKNNVLMAKGKTDVAFKINLIRNMLILITILIINKYGIKMMLIFNALISYLFFIVSSLFIKKYIGYTLYKQIKDVLPFVLCTLLAALNIFLIQKFTQINSIFFLFIVKLAIGLVSYLMACYFLKIKTLFDNLSLLFNLFKRQRLTI